MNESSSSWQLPFLKLKDNWLALRIIGKKEKVLEVREMQNKNIIWNIIQGLKAYSQEQAEKNLREEIRSK